MNQRTLRQAIGEPSTDLLLARENLSAILRNTSVFGYDGLAVRRFSRRTTDYKSVVPVLLAHCGGSPGEELF